MFDPSHHAFISWKCSQSQNSSPQKFHLLNIFISTLKPFFSDPSSISFHTLFLFLTNPSRSCFSLQFHSFKSINFDFWNSIFFGFCFFCLISVKKFLFMVQQHRFIRILSFFSLITIFFISIFEFINWFGTVHGFDVKFGTLCYIWL